MSIEKVGTNLDAKSKPHREDKQLLEISEVLPTTEHLIDRTTPVDKLIPIPKTAPLDILSRPLKRIYTLFPGSQIVLDPFSEIVNSNRWASYAKYYSLWRTDLNIRIMLRTNTAQYGFVGVFWNYPTTMLLGSTEVWGNAWTTHPYLLDLAVSEVLEFDIPYANERDLQTVNPYTKNLDMILANLGSRSITPGGTTEVELIMYITPKNLQIGGAVDAQADAVERVASVGNVLGTAAVAFSLDSFRRTFFSETVPLAVDSINHLANSTSTGLKYAGDAISNSHQKERGSFNDQTPYRVSYFGDLASGAQNNNIYTLGYSKSIALVDPEDVGDQLGYVHPLVNLCKLPGLGRGFTISKALNHITSAGAVLSENIGINCAAGWASYLSKMFRFYRGSVRLVLFFSCSPNTTARFAYKMEYPFPDAAQVNSVNFNTITDSFSIKGSQQKIIDIPYHARTKILETGESFARFTLICTQTPTSFASGGDAGVELLVTASMTDDLQLFSPQTFSARAITSLVNPETSLREIHSRPMEGGMSARIKPVKRVDELFNLEELMKRWSEAPTNVSSITQSLRPVITQQQFVDAENMTKCAVPFAFRAGGVEYKIYYESFELNLTIISMSPQLQPGAPQTLPIGNGALQQFTSLWPVIEFRVPYLSRFTVKKTDAIFSFRVDITSRGTPPQLTEVMIRSAPDFQLFAANGLPNLEWWYTPDAPPPP